MLMLLVEVELKIGESTIAPYNVHWTPVLAGQNALKIWPHYLHPIEIEDISGRPKKFKIVTRVTQDDSGGKKKQYASLNVTLELKNDSSPSTYDDNRRILVASHPGTKKLARAVTAISDTYSLSLAQTFEKDETCLVSLNGQVKHKASADFNPRVITQGMELKVCVYIFMYI